MLAVSSCTAALHLSLVALGVGPGDEVITTSNTWPATANVIVHCGAMPVFADIRPDTLFAPFHWGGKSAANLLTVPALDPVSRMPEFKVCAVRATAVAGSV